MNDPVFSYEFFPPRTQLGERRFWRTLGRLEAQQAAFFSITYGALGTAQEVSIEAVESAAKESDTPIAAHLTFEGSTKDEIDAVARRYKEAGVDRIVALRGDARDDAEQAAKRGACYQNVPEFIDGLLQIHPFDISVACYPDVHPKAKCQESDLLALKEKVDAGANRAITQFFFDADDYLRFTEHASAVGINVPIVAGVLPIRDFSKVMTFAKQCGAKVPSSLVDKFQAVEGDAHATAILAQRQLDEFVEQLIDNGCRHFHIYTLNQIVEIKRDPPRSFSDHRSAAVITA